MKIIGNLAFSNDRKNKTRSILIIIAVTLTTMLLTIISMYCFGIIQHNRLNAEIYYGDYCGVYRGTTRKQIQEMKLHSEFSRLGSMAYAGEAEHDVGVSLYCADASAWEMTNLEQQLQSGKRPETEKEIAGTEAFFEAMGVKNPQLGKKVFLRCRSNKKSKYSTHTFVISGLLQEPDTEITPRGYTGYVSEEFYDRQVVEENRNYYVYFKLSDNISINTDNAESVIKGLAEQCGINEKQVSVNKGYVMWAMDPGVETIAMGILLSFCVVLFSVVVIYNIFQVGITQKIQEYGKIKALGATKKQLKKIVLLEGMILAVIGIPIGLLSGGIIASKVFEWSMRQGELMNTGIGLTKVNLLSLPLLMGVVLIALVTVRIALRKPMKIVSGISAVEAMRFQNQTGAGKNIRKGHRKIGIREMAMASLAANKKRTLGTILTMGLSCVLFVALASFAGNMDAEYEARQQVEYGQFLLELDYDSQDEAYPENNQDAVLRKNPLGPDMVKRIRALDGVTGVKVRKQLILRTIDKHGKKSKQMKSVLVYDKDAFQKKEEEYTTVGTCDYDQISKKNGIVYGWAHFLEEEGYELEDSLNGILETPTQETIYQGNIQGAFGNANAEWIITEDTLKKLGIINASNGQLWVDCKEKDQKKVQKELEELLLAEDHVVMTTYQEALRTNQISMRMLQVISYSFLAILGLIGFINMANTIIISIITRKQELGMLQAMGMTNRQLNRMLQMEGMVFTIGTMVAAMIIGIPAGYGLFFFGRGQGWIGLYQYHFPWKEMLIMGISIAVLQIALSFFLSRNLRKESLVERIRY